MRKMMVLALALATLAFPVFALGAEPVVLGDNPPVIIPLKPANIDVLVEGEQPLGINEVTAAPAGFVPATSIAKLESTKRYWLSFDIINSVVRDRDFRLANRTFGLRDLRVYVVHANGERQDYTRNYIQLPPQNELIRSSPFLASEPPNSTASSRKCTSSWSARSTMRAGCSAASCHGSTASMAGSRR